MLAGVIQEVSSAPPVEGEKRTGAGGVGWMSCSGPVLVVDGGGRL